MLNEPELLHTVFEFKTNRPCVCPYIHRCGCCYLGYGQQLLIRYVHTYIQYVRINERLLLSRVVAI